MATINDDNDEIIVDLNLMLTATIDDDDDEEVDMDLSSISHWHVAQVKSGGLSPYILNSITTRYDQDTNPENMSKF